MSDPIYIFSDSHNVMFNDSLYWGEDFVFKYRDYTEDSIFRIALGGSYTAHSLDIHDDKIKEVLAGLENVRIWFGYGEIDCRFYIFNQHVKNNTSICAEVEKVILNYLEYVSGLKNSGYDISIVSVVPAKRTVITGANPLTNEVGDGGDPVERRYITEIFNSALKYRCREYDIEFIDIYHYLVDPKDGFNRIDMLLPYCIPEEALLGKKDGMHYAYIGDLLKEKGVV